MLIRCLGRFRPFPFSTAIGGPGRSISSFRSGLSADHRALLSKDPAACTIDLVTVVHLVPRYCEPQNSVKPGLRGAAVSMADGGADVGELVQGCAPQMGLCSLSSLVVSDNAREK